MSDKFAKDLVQKHEGREKHRYFDSANHPTVGVGFNLDRADAQQKLTDVGADYTAVRDGKADLTEDQIDQLFNDDFINAKAGAKKDVSNFDSLPEKQQSVVIDMVFNMGAKKFRTFENLISALENNDYETAATEIENSDWYTQVGNRGVEDAALMRAK